jgi:2-polyprenyl-3-methyl-5-hydroxy-6-metoxy-1,4-benzoquinol methylase
MTENNKWDDNFFSKRKHIAWRANIVCGQIIKQFHPASVIDVGCGIGEFLKVFYDLGIIIKGVESTEAVLPYLMFPQDKIEIHDIVDQRLIPDVRFDVALCFMVVGRLPERQWNNMAHALTELSDTVITVVEDNLTWQDCMAEYGYHEDLEADFEFRDALRPWFNKTAVRSFQFTQIFRRTK